MEELKLHLRELRRKGRGSVKFPSLEGHRHIVLHSDGCSLRFHYNGKDVDEIHYINEDSSEELVGADFTKHHAYFNLEPTDEALKKMYLDDFPDADPALGWSVALDDMRSKGVWEGDYYTEIEGENTRLLISYTSGNIVTLEYEITNSEFGEISGKTLISENEMKIFVEKV